MGYLPQNFRVFSKLKTWEFLDYVASLAGLRNKAQRLNAVDEMLENVGLFDVRNRQANKLSGGMKRRLGIAQALIGEPKIVIIDEPTTGLDPEERIRFRNLLSEMSRKEIIIILSTHIVGDISSTCRSMAVLEKGRLAFKGSPDGLISKAKGHVFQVNVAENEMNAIMETYPVISTIPSGSGWDVQIVADKLNGFEGSEVEPTLEHAYVYFMEYEQHQSVVNSTI
jgi:ABC-type multidrug transport system ATPase subunit